MNVQAASSLDYRALYQLAFEEFGSVALWNNARLTEPSPEHALVIAQALRAEGNRSARSLAEAIEAAARAAL